MTSATTAGPCPCGTGRPFASCCAPVIAGAPAGTAEELMRSRYSAFAVGDLPHLLRSWHSSTRPARLVLDAAQRWTGLEVLATSGGSGFHVEGEVEFRAHLVEDGVAAVVRERSAFVREAGRWVYLGPVARPAGP